ncbi:GAC1 [Candida metapsilosis]|uniref:GAC1 n=1 Tax=Candida metapsilosis TaxID=273372 RepID=A0A8H8DBP5_9ASCO|nr:GAC1 [Candida metapsilosis]
MSSTITTIDLPSRTYTISPPSSTTSSSRSTSPVTSFYQSSSSASSSTDSLDTVKSTASTSTIKLVQPQPKSSSSDSITIPVSRTPTPSPSQSAAATVSQPQQKPKFKLPNYYVPPAKLVQQPTVASQTQSTSNTLQSAALSSTTAKPPLLRKKSGELIKSSLKLPGLLQRSISSPNITTEGEVGGIVSPRKSVRFASRLINVRMFDGFDTPASVSSAGSPLDSPDEGEEEEEEEQDYFYTSSGKHDSSFDLSVPAYEDFEFSKFTNRTTNFDWNFNFAKPKDEIKEYRLTSHNIPSGRNFNATSSSPDSSKIWMTSAYLLKVNNKTYLCGWLNVVNIAFSKDINLKLTIDNWESSIIVGGITKYQKSLDSNLDQFKFMLDLESFNIVDEKTIELCLEYNTNGQTYWGNNRNQNYKFHIERKVKKPVAEQRPTSSLSTSSRSRSRSKSKSSADNKQSTINSSGYEEICNKLLNHKSTLALNFANDEFSFRPSLRKSHSASDITSTTPTTSYGTPKYSNRQRQKDNKQGATTATGTATGTATSGIKDMTYADILQKYCFAGTPTTTSPPSKADSTTATTTCAAKGPSPALAASAPASAHSSPMLGTSSFPSSPPVAAVAAPTQKSIFI